MSREAAQPRTIWEKPPDEVASGMRISVRGAVFQIGGRGRSAVTVTIAVPDGYHAPLPERGCTATILLNPDEAEGLSAWLKDAAASALSAAPPMYE